MGRAATAFFAAVAPLALCTCRSPTEVTLVLTTNACDAGYQATSIQVVSAGASVDAATTVTQNCAPDGSIGTLVVVPGSSGDVPFVVRIVTQLGGRGQPADCNVDASHCIIATREMGFIDNTPLTLPIEMEKSCEGVACDGGFTCVERKCVSSTVNVPECVTNCNFYTADASAPGFIEASTMMMPPRDAQPHDARGVAPDASRDDDSGSGTGSSSGNPSGGSSTSGSGSGSSTSTALTSTTTTNSTSNSSPSSSANSSPSSSGNSSPSSSGNSSPSSSGSSSSSHSSIGSLEAGAASGP